MNNPLQIQYENWSHKCNGCMTAMLTQEYWAKYNIFVLLLGETAQLASGFGTNIIIYK